MRVVTRTKDGTETKDIWYALGVRHEVTYVHDLCGVLLYTHVTMERSKI